MINKKEIVEIINKNVLTKEDANKLKEVFKEWFSINDIEFLEVKENEFALFHRTKDITKELEKNKEEFYDYLAKNVELKNLSYFINMLKAKIDNNNHLN